VTGFGGHAFDHWLSLPFTIVWLLACTNAVNLIDGVDGLAAASGCFATCTTLLAALLQGNVELALATVPLAGALLGFLRYNFNPATVFSGRFRKSSGGLSAGMLWGPLEPEVRNHPRMNGAADGRSPFRCSIPSLAICAPFPA